MSDARIVLSTCPDAPSAETIARALVEERLAACVNLVPGVRSIYRWRAAVEEADEILLVIKTTAGRVEALAKRIEELHAYDVPEVIVFAAEGGSAGYLDWIGKSVAL